MDVLAVPADVLPSLGLVAAVAAGLAARRSVWVTRVVSGSMAPTLRPGNLLLTRRLGRSEPLRRGDILVLRSAELDRTAVKRLIGLPGERVQVGSRGVRIDGAFLSEAYVRRHGGPGGTFHVPPGAYLVLGDDRVRSSDSRSWRVPFVPRRAIEGRIVGPLGFRRAGLPPPWLYRAGLRPPGFRRAGLRPPWFHQARLSGAPPDHRSCNAIASAR